MTRIPLVQPFRIEVPRAELDDLRRRLAATRWPEPETVDDWSQGIPLSYVQEVCETWRRDYDWRQCEARLNALPQFRTLLQALGIHFLHLRSSHNSARPLILLHGWPGSIREFLDVLEPLTQPELHGGEPTDAFHVVCPSLPGFGFSDKPTRPGWSVERIADAFAQLMERLGYPRYFAQGGDWGAGIASAMALQDAEHCAGIHLNMPTVRPPREALQSPSEQERHALAALQHYRDWDSGYSKQQSTRPQTLGYALVDSPAGQAAWILEKFWSWTDCDGHPENAISREALLDNVTLYWLTCSAASSGRIYWESFGRGSLEPIDIPVGCSIFPKEIFPAPRHWAEQRYRKLVYWNELDRGGHFAAMEQPKLFVEELRRCFRSMTL